MPIVREKKDSGFLIKEPSLMSTPIVTDPSSLIQAVHTIPIKVGAYRVVNNFVYLLSQDDMLYKLDLLVSASGVEWRQLRAVKLQTGEFASCSLSVNLRHVLVTGFDQGNKTTSIEVFNENLGFIARTKVSSAAPFRNTLLTHFHGLKVLMLYVSRVSTRFFTLFEGKIEEIMSPSK